MSLADVANAPVSLMGFPRQDVTRAIIFQSALSAHVLSL